MKYCEIATELACANMNSYNKNEGFNCISNSHETLDTRWNGEVVHQKSYDAVVFSVLKVAPEDFASQLTLMDFEVFKKIQPEELSSCCWNKKEKMTYAPNVVAFTQRFNHVSLWAVKEILSGQTPKARADIIAHFIKVAKRLHELNNLHSESAIISALQSASIFRLSNTWPQLSKKDKSAFDKLADVFSDANNFEKLRDHMTNTKLPCIPYLGLFLKDLVFIDIAHPPTQGLDNHHRQMKMNNILRLIAEYQQSNYDHLPFLPHVQNYLRSVRYIDELQKFVEDENYKLSLELEPMKSSPNLRDSSSHRHLVTEDLKVSSRNSLGVPGSLEARSSRSMPGHGSRFVPTHRKAWSLGTNVMSSLSVDTLSSCSTFSSERHLLDDSILEHPPVLTRKRSLGSIEDIHDHFDTWLEHLPLNSSEYQEINLRHIDAVATFQGYVRRKTVLKEGKKPAMSPWMRYWLVLKGTTLIYFPPKTLRGQDKSDFKSTPSKSFDVSGSIVVCADTGNQPDAFQLTDPVKGNVYKFRTGSPAKTVQWYNYLRKATNQYDECTHLENLMTFE
ncbi:ras-specific guanine nucleotide-releasing factor RalGPS1 [Trichonephila clavipes]|uniref:Ras-specific guanine nucleotide-releasing factor RalGPS1 n=2 Tax=Trichonephila TaxID=2585208 RepID=A0A8X6LE58_TRICU|nr:ras-specific guanine nucleotide-releasing factor RalGPS1 [Trichonephila clavata]GFS89040.1 ras-specific guanine nucleotide-releasing factor RalGPS1 [Trichonephila clavipes]GFY64386.1 ras-specific guanine nucleotide-releasing factor RalGPS1 [Trichonephila inaurata madagascariensis]